MSRNLPEITPKALILGAILSVILGAANVYLGLKAGMTVAASIPAAVISMGVLRLFHRTNILENNIVQTAASAGESLAAGVIFTLPALLILHWWSEFSYWQTTAIATLGGVMGVLYTIPLRRALIVEGDLKYPEGLATAEVLKVGDEGGRGVRVLALGGVVGAVFKFAETGLRVIPQAVEGGVRAGGAVIGFSMDLAPALIGVGYIVGINIAVLVFIGGAVNWFVAIPVLSAVDGVPEAPTLYESAQIVWSTQTRYIGVGAMLLGGLWALVRMLPMIVKGIRSGFEAYRKTRLGEGPGAPERQERDTPMKFVAIGLAICIAALVALYYQITGSVLTTAVMALVMPVAGFLFSAVAAYMAGLVGSSNNPISGVTIATVLTAAFLLLALGVDPAVGPAAALLIGAVVCCAAAIGGDNMQDLKTGRVVGATPYKQQIMQMVGVVTGALVMAPILTLLLHAYGLGDLTVEGQTPLSAPQATLMASVAKGVFDMDLPWLMLFVGAALAAVIIFADVILEARKAAFRMPVLAVAVGIYLPLGLDTAILAGGLIAFAANRFHMRRLGDDEMEEELHASFTEARDATQRNGLLMAAGLITGEALLGILLAVPLVLTGGRNLFELDLGESTLHGWLPSGIGLGMMTVLVLLLYRTATRRGSGS